MSEPIVIFYPNMEKIVGIRGQCIAYLREVHIDEKYMNHPKISMIIQHEKKHQVYCDKIMNVSGKFQRWRSVMQNNIWDFFSVWKILYYINKSEFTFTTLTVFGFISMVILVILGAI